MAHPGALLRRWKMRGQVDARATAQAAAFAVQGHAASWLIGRVIRARRPRQPGLAAAGGRCRRTRLRVGQPAAAYRALAVVAATGGQRILRHPERAEHRHQPDRDVRSGPGGFDRHGGRDLRTFMYLGAIASASLISLSFGHAAPTRACTASRSCSPPRRWCCSPPFSPTVSSLLPHQDRLIASAARWGVSGREWRSLRPRTSRPARRPAAGPVRIRAAAGKGIWGGMRSWGVEQNDASSPSSTPPPRTTACGSC